MGPIEQTNTLYVSPNSQFGTEQLHESITRALASAALILHERREIDNLSAKPIVNRGVAVIVALDPHRKPEDANSVLAIGQIGEVNPNYFPLFVRKAGIRAFRQRNRGARTDTDPMERLLWVPDNALHLGCTASSRGLHVGTAGPWPHHAREMAVSFATTLADSLSLPDDTTPGSVALREDSEATERLAWLDRGQDAGDNTPREKKARGRYTFLLGLIAQAR